MTPEEKWEELRRHLEESVFWYCQQQCRPAADHFYFFLKEGHTKDILAYMEYLDKDGKNSGDKINLSELLAQKTKAHYIMLAGGISDAPKAP
jgi:hypothetical protein